MVQLIDEVAYIEFQPPNPIVKSIYFVSDQYDYVDSNSCGLCEPPFADLTICPAQCTSILACYQHCSNDR